MKEHSIQNVFPGYEDNIADLKTVRPIPSPRVKMIDPFLFLNHHGPQVYPENNDGLPFGPHPHRGFQTVTVVVAGDIAHKDSAGNESVIVAGGVQWMSAGRGLVHEEISSADFKKNGGPLEILQLWVNLPAKHKFTDPWYRGLQKSEIPTVLIDRDRVHVQVLAGNVEGVDGAFTPSTDLSALMIEIKNGGTFKLNIGKSRNIFFYVVRGEVSVSEQVISAMNLVQFNADGDGLVMSANGDALILLCHAIPYNESVVSAGPFVMNTKEEIQKAYKDLHAGRF